jgi:hypothetical protein
LLGEEYLPHGVFTQKPKREGRGRGRGQKEEDDHETALEKDDLAMEREFEYRRRKEGTGNLQQLKQHRFVVLRSEHGVFQWEFDSSILLSKTTPLRQLPNPIFKVTYTICDLIFRTNWRNIMVGQFEYLLENCKRDLQPARKKLVVQTFNVYLSATEREITKGGEGWHTTRTFWDSLVGTENYTEIADIATRLLVCGRSEAEAERVMSILRRILNRHRGRLSASTIFWLLQIYLHGLRTAHL